MIGGCRAAWHSIGLVTLRSHLIGLYFIMSNLIDSHTVMSDMIGTRCVSRNVISAVGDPFHCLFIINSKSSLF